MKASAGSPPGPGPDPDPTVRAVPPALVAAVALGLVALAGVAGWMLVAGTGPDEELLAVVTPARSGTTTAATGAAPTSTHRTATRNPFEGPSTTTATTTTTTTTGTTATTGTTTGATATGTVAPGQVVLVGFGTGTDEAVFTVDGESRTVAPGRTFSTYDLVYVERATDTCATLRDGATVLVLCENQTYYVQ